MIEVAMGHEAMLLRSAANSIRQSLPNPVLPVQAFESLGWADLPVMIQRAEHPSYSSSRNYRQAQPEGQQENQPPSVASSPVEAAAVGAARQQQQQNTFELSWAKPQSFTTFGWGDFPIGSDHSSSSSKKAFVARQTMLKEKQQPGPSELHRTPTVSFQAAPLQLRLRNCPLSTTDAIFKTTTESLRRVRFSQVHIREHSIRLGDHPLCHSYPISLDWSHGEDRIISVDEYEKQRCSERRTTSGELRMDVLERRSALSESMGLTLVQMDALERERIQQKWGCTLELHRSKSSLGCNQADTRNILEMSIGDAGHSGLDSQLAVR